LKILVMRGGGVGDFILTFPALAALRRHFPDSTVEILGYPAIAALAVNGGLAQRVTPVEAPFLAGFFIRNGELSEKGRRYFAGFDLILSYLHDPDRVLQSNIAQCSAAKFIAGPHRPEETLREHATLTLLRPLEALRISGADPLPRLELPGEPPWVEGNWLALHPGSGSVRKNWPEPVWGELLRRLANETTWNFLLIGGEAEGDRCRRLAQGLPPSRIRFAENLPLVELARQMSSCAAFIGHDSGITHLAAALDLAGVVLWGPTDETTWRPAGQRMRLVHGEPNVQAAFDAILELSCEPRPPR
jgi:heptosyltransferase-3